MKEKKARVEDAMHATKAAVEEGIVPGGGVALIRASKVLDGLKLDGDQQIGVNIVTRAIEEPMRWIATNAGHEGSIVVQKVREMKDDEGFNALTDTYEDLVKAGVIDPAKVVRSALQNSSSIASLLLTTEALISRDSRGEEGSAGDAGRRRHGRDVLRVRNSEVRNSEFEIRKARRAKAAGPFCFRARSQLLTSAQLDASALYRSVNVSSIVMRTGTGFAEPRAGREAPLARGVDGLLIETERRIERAHHLDVADAAVRPDDALEQDGALHLGAHRVRGVLRPLFVQHARQRDAVAGPIDAAAGAAAATRARDPSPCPDRRRSPCRCPRRRRCRIPATASAVPAALRSRPAASPAPPRGSSPECSAARPGRAPSSTSCISIFGGFRHGNRNLVLARHLRLTRRLLHLVAAAATAAAGTGLAQPDDVRVGLLGQQRRQ